MRNLKSNAEINFLLMFLSRFFFSLGIVTICFFSYICRAWSIESPFNDLDLNTHKRLEGYSFFICGHLYGSPYNRSSVLPSPSILAACDIINNSDAMFFISLGDNFIQLTPTSISLFKKYSNTEPPILEPNTSDNCARVAFLIRETLPKVFNKFFFRISPIPGI